MEEFIAKYDGKKVGYPDGQYVGECLSIVKVYIKEKFGFNPPASGNGSAYGYWTNFPAPLGDYFDKVPNTPSGYPKSGDIVIWGTGIGSYGHIAIATARTTVDKLDCFEQNFPKGSACHTQSHNYNNVLGWLTPKNVSQPVDNCKDDLNKCYNERNSLTSQLDQSQKQTETYKVAGQELKSQLDATTSQLSAKDGELNTCRDLFQKCELELGKVKQELQMSKSIEDYTWQELLKEAFKKLGESWKK